MEVVKITKRTYRVLQAVDKPFLKFGAFRKVREERLGLSLDRCCFNCGRKFKEDDDIYLVMLKGTHNRLFCKECNDKALDDLERRPR